MGEVFLAYDDRLDRLVAIKRMRPDALRDPSRRERLRREARAAARLSHPNIVQVYDLEEDEEGGDAIVLEYVQGRTVAELLGGGPLPVDQAVELAAQVADGLAAAHAAGLVHRDLKAENVVVTDEGRAKILDFGLVKPLDPGADSTLTEHGAVLGTYRAMAPEQAEGGEVDTRADLFSFGVLLYEMLAGRSPFQGATPVATLRNVTGAAARPLAEVRPELPADLTELVHALLEKEPERRPAGAREVLARLRSLDGAGFAGTRPAGEETSALSTLRRPRRKLLGAAGALALLAAALTWLVTETGLGRREPLRVAIPKPALTAGAEGLDLVASGTLMAALRTFLALDRVTAIEPSQIGDVAGSPAEIARAVSADEVLALTIEPSGPREAFISLRRLRAEDGAVLWAERFPIPATRDGALVLAEGVAGAVRRAYPRLDVRAGAPDLEVRPDDYAEFVEIWQRLQAGRGAWAPELGRLEAIGSQSPRFLEAHLQAATLALNLFQDSRDAADLARARVALGAAKSLAPAQPRVLSTEVLVALGAGDLEQAEAALGHLEQEMPGDPVVDTQRVRIAEARGDLPEAIRILRGMMARHPTWRGWMRLADFELRDGDIVSARLHLEEAARLVPGNTWPVARLGELELAYGDLQRAAAIYRGLIAKGPQRSDLTNLGLVQFLLGDFEAAAVSFRRALALDPGHLAVTLNLADVELARGRRTEALALYREALTSLSRKAAASPLTPVERCLEAQCRAHLGEARQAVAIALEVLQGHPRDAEVTYQASLVFALAGEDASALALARKARELGMQERWFLIPAFRRLRSELGVQ
jgi:tetratricopeptide (TPR) repeat protein